MHRRRKSGSFEPFAVLRSLVVASDLCELPVLVKISVHRFAHGDQ